MKRWICWMVFLLFADYGMAQTTFNGWLGSFNSFKINKRFSIHLDVQARSSDQLEHLGTFIFRPGVNLHFRKNMFFTAGYALVENRRSIQGVAGYVPEHRIWQQLVLNHHAGFIPVQHRLRLEQRFIGKYSLTNGELETDGNRFAHRLRYFVRSIIPFNGSKPFTQGVFAAIQNEVFMNIGDKSAVNGRFFDQNRLYLALGYRLSQKVDLEGGYLNQYISGANKTITRAHIVQLGTYLRL